VQTKAAPKLDEQTNAYALDAYSAIIWRWLDEQVHLLQASIGNPATLRVLAQRAMSLI
jgi:hypothetical protein